MEANELNQYMQATTFGKADKQQRANSCYVFKGIVDGKLTWEFPSLKRTITVDPEKASAANRARCMVFGLKQRVQDGGAVDANKATGKVDPQEKYDEMLRVATHLESGSTDWAITTRVGATAASYVTKALIRIGKYQGFDVSDSDKANAFILKLANLEKFGLGGQVGKAREWLEANSKQVKETIALIREEEAKQATFDADAALGELMAPPEDPEAELRVANAIEMFNAGAASLEEAAEEAGMTVEDFTAAVEAAKDEEEEQPQA